MFDIRVFGYDTGQVDSLIEELNQQIYAQKCDLKYLKKENERLNNIINELEKYLWEERRSHQGEYIFTDNRGVEIYTMIFYKLQELKLKESE